MTRRVYVEEQDLENARIAARVIEREWGCKMVEAPGKMSKYNFELYRDGVRTAFVEIRRRNMQFGKFPTVMLAGHKYSDGIEYKQKYGVPFIVVVCCNDKIIAHSLREDRTEYKFGSGGRVDRGDPADIEGCFFIPNKLFTVVVSNWTNGIQRVLA